MLSSASIDTAMLGNLLFGIYTVVYFMTMYIYLIKRQFQQRIVFVVVSCSYLVYSVITGTQWYILKRDIASGVDTILSAAHHSPLWIIYCATMCNCIQAVLADGLMIWRCFHVWNRSLRLIAVPSFLLLSEIVIDSFTIFTCVESSMALAPGKALNSLITAFFFVNLATTLITTFLISYRIYTVSTGAVGKTSRTRFRQIVEIVVQSAALYTLAAIPHAISPLFHVSSSSRTDLFSVRAYSSTWINFVAGIAPTIMVARVALLADKSQGTVAFDRVTDLTFNRVDTTIPVGVWK